MSGLPLGLRDKIHKDFIWGEWTALSSGPDSLVGLSACPIRPTSVEVWTNGPGGWTQRTGNGSEVGPSDWILAQTDRGSRELQEDQEDPWEPVEVPERVLQQIEKLPEPALTGRGIAGEISFS